MMHTSRVMVAVVLIATAAGLTSGCRRDVDYLPAERAERNEIVTALEVFRKDTGRYPTVREGLQALLRDPDVGDWRGPYYPESKRTVLEQYRYDLTRNGAFRLERVAGSTRAPSERKAR